MNVDSFANLGLYDTTHYHIRWTILTCAQKLTSRQLNLPHRTKQSNEETKKKNKKTDMLRRNGPVVKSVESVLRLVESLCGKDL